MPPRRMAANANATIHKGRDAFTETTPICPLLPSSFCFSLLSSQAGAAAAAIQIRTPVRHPADRDRQTGPKIAMAFPVSLFVLPPFSLGAAFTFALLRLSPTRARI